MSWFNHFLHKFLASKTKHFMAWNWLQVKYATNLILMNINIKRFFLLQPPSLKDEGHPDHLQRFHHRCNHINIITGPGYIVKKLQKIQLSGRAQYNTASQNKNWRKKTNFSRSLWKSCCASGSSSSSSAQKCQASTFTSRASFVQRHKIIATSCRHSQY